MASFIWIAGIPVPILHIVGLPYLIQLVMKKVLIVDDSHQVRNMLNKLLPTYGDIDIVGECINGIEAIAFVNDNEVDAIIMDYHMPGLDGIQTSERIKAKLPDIYIILFTSVKEMSIRTDAVNDIVFKPGDLSDMAKLIEQNS